MQKTAEAIEMTHVGQRNHALNGGLRERAFFVGACAGPRRCGLLPNYFEHLLKFSSKFVIKSSLKIVPHLKRVAW